MEHRGETTAARRQQPGDTALGHRVLWSSAVAEVRPPLSLLLNLSISRVAQFRAQELFQGTAAYPPLSGCGLIPFQLALVQIAINAPETTAQLRCRFLWL